jgi:hypothetical protein
MDFIRAVGQSQRSRVRPRCGQEMIIAHTTPAVSLDRTIDNSQCHIGRYDLDHRNLASGDFVSDGVHEMGGMHGQESSLIDFDTRISDIRSNRPMLGEFFSKRDSRLNSLAHRFQRALGQPDQSHAMVDSPGSETALSDFESSTFTEQDAVDRDSYILKQYFGVAVRRVVVPVHREHPLDGDPG